MEDYEQWQLEDKTVDNSTLSLGENDTEMGYNNGTGSGAYCGRWLLEVGLGYGEAHGYVSLLVCLFGSILNVLNLVVLTRREMLNPTNTILTGLAFADLLNELEYMPFALFMNVLKGPNFPPKTYPWALFVLAHSNFSQVCHTISIWLTVTLAVWRYIMVAMPMRNKTLCSSERANFAVGIAYIGSLLVCIPVYLTYQINQRTDNASIYLVGYSSLALAHEKFLVNANFWTYSVVIKLLPCILLTIVSFRLINSLVAARRRKAQLKGAGDDGGGGGDRTTRMLLAVLLLFLMTEFPQGILGLLSLILGDAFFSSCYMPLGDLMDIIALSNCATNFILYTSMSAKFRQVFIRTFHLGSLCPQRLSPESSTPTRMRHCSKDT